MNVHFLLYVEDDPSNRLVMQLLIEKTLNTKNYAIFEDSKDFMGRLRSLRVCPSLIMLDIHIAPLNGFQLLKMIREDATYVDTKVIALTASVMNEEVAKLRENGFDGAIGKPIALSSFPATIERILKGETVWQV
jgi:two-component system, cell cycle response regulator DivK